MTNDIVTVMAQGSMKAAARMILETPRFPRLKAEAGVDMNRYSELVTGALRQTLQANISGYMDAWRDAVEAHIGDGWITTLVNTQCNEVALQALKAVEEEL